MVAMLVRLLNSRIWIALSIVCLFFALYQSIEKTIEGKEIEGVLDFLVMLVIAVNLVNKLKMLTTYVEKLRH